MREFNVREICLVKVEGEVAEHGRKGRVEFGIS